MAFSYVRDKGIYADFRTFLESHATAKLSYMKAHCPNDAETLMLFLDLIVCPYVTAVTKSALGQTFGLSAQELADMQGLADMWFTTWSPFDLAKELDAKRSREVY